MRKKIIICILGLSVSVLNFISCGSTPKFSGKGDFCALIVDEKNQPVNQVILDCYKNGIEIGKGISNENGMVLIENIYGGKYDIRLRKTGYEKLEKQQVTFSDRSSVFCFQLRSGDSILDEVELKYGDRKYEEGIEKLNKLYFEKQDYVNMLFSYYKAYGLLKLGRKKEAGVELKKIDHQKNFSVDKAKLIRLLEDK